MICRCNIEIELQSSVADGGSDGQGCTGYLMAGEQMLPGLRVSRIVVGPTSDIAPLPTRQSWLTRLLAQTHARALKVEQRVPRVYSYGRLGANGGELPGPES